MDLSFIIPSKIRRQVLAYFVEDPDAQVYVRELARELGESPQQVYRELINLENWGYLFSSKRGNQRVFRLNKKFPFYDGIKDMFERSREEKNRNFNVVKTYKLEDRVKKLRKIPVPKELLEDLSAKRTKPRSYDETRLLEKLEPDDD
jgi:predicted transcriptional regulator with HTH domain